MGGVSTASSWATAALRAVGFGLLFTAGAWSLSSAWLPAVCIGTAALLVALLERRIARGECPAFAEEQREAAAALISLELSHDRVQSVLESLREGVIVVDSGGEIVLANPAARRAMSGSHPEPLGRLLWEVLPGEMARFARAAWRALRDESARQPDAAVAPPIRHSSIPCRDRYFDLTAVPVTSTESGQDFGTVFLLVDATRNHELQRLKDRFLSSVSHELRTPLTNICAYSEILSTLVPGEAAEWPEFVRVINEESVQLSCLVDGMFDFLQLESGEAVFHLEVLDCAGVVTGVLAAVADRITAAEIRLESELAEGGGEVEVDRQRLEQVCRHLVDNAIKFTPTNGRVRVSCGRVGEAFELRVEDSGPGVPVSERFSVFDKFTQLRDHLTEKPTGAGLGLATCRAIVGRFGGLIWCEDSDLGGAGFVVRLPLAGKPQLAGAGARGGF